MACRIQSNLFSKGKPQVEFNEWARVNKSLREHGLPTVDLAHPGKVHNKSDLVMFESEMSKRLRDNFQALLSDCVRRQELVQDLISANNQLREELKAQTVVSERYETRARDLKMMLDSSKLQIEDLKEEVLSASSVKLHENEKVKNTHSEVKAECKKLKNKCETYEAEIDRLNDKMRKINEEEVKRASKQRQVFMQLKRRIGRGSVDDKILDLIECYERQVFDLQKELDHCRPSDERLNDSKGTEKSGSENCNGNSGTPHLKELIKSYEKRLKESKNKVKLLENEVETVKLELQGRPDLKEYRVCQSKLSRMERLVKKHNLVEMDDSLCRHKGRSYSTELEDLDYLPLYQCRKYLREMCEAMEVTDLDLIIPKLEKAAKSSGALPKLEEFAREVLTVVNTDDVPLPAEYSGQEWRKSGTSHKVWCEKTSRHVLPILKHWTRQLRSLRELRSSVNKLSHAAVPWRSTSDSTSSPNTLSLIEAVDAITYELETGNDQSETKNGKQQQVCSRSMLQAIVDHFMNLFDVKKVTGCYPRMSDLYSKLGETHNVLKTLKDLLGLTTDAKSSVIVDSVSRLMKLQNSSAHKQLSKILPGEDLDSICKKVEIYDEFFPMFQAIIKKLMDILDVARIDQIVPQVRSLKVLALGRS